MTPRERHEYSSLVSDLLAPCPNVPVSIAQCVQEKRPARPAPRRRSGSPTRCARASGESQIQAAFKERYDPAGQKALPLAGSPSKGPENAKVTVVEFADFECPHCRMAVPMIDQVHGRARRTRSASSTSSSSCRCTCTPRPRPARRMGRGPAGQVLGDGAPALRAAGPPRAGRSRALRAHPEARPREVEVGHGVARPRRTAWPRTSGSRTT